jgi:putative ABC transport system permease protein
MNLMLTAVAQRAHEIGLRRAMGARESDISRQFLLESLLVALVGGLTGLVVGVGVALALSAAGLASSRLTWMPFLLSLVACTAIGITFGLVPARRAARIDPASTMRERTT